MATSIRILFDETRIAARNQALAEEIAASAPKDLLMIAILKGAFMFAADLARALHKAGLEPSLDFLQLSSYGDAQVSSGQVSIAQDLEIDVSGRTILLIDDILESGRTLAFARDRLLARGAARVLICALLEKPGKRAVSAAADFVGFECPDLFVIGYGMDAAQSYRQLPFVGVVEGSLTGPAAAA